MRIEICIPAFNEEAVIETSVIAIAEVLGELSPENAVIVAVNGSTDATADCARRVPSARVIELHESGKGRAIRAAAHTSKADIFGFIDADLSADPHDISTFVRAIREEGYDIVIGSRLMNTSTVRRGVLRTLSSKLFNAMRAYIVGLHVSDTQCGLKLMNEHGRSILSLCEENGWFLDVEFLIRAEHAGLRIKEIPVHWHEFRYINRSSKLRLIRDGMQAIGAMLRIRRRLFQSVDLRYRQSQV